MQIRIACNLFLMTEQQSLVLKTQFTQSEIPDNRITLTNEASHHRHWHHQPTSVPEGLLPPSQKGPTSAPHLFHEEQSDPLKHLVPVECRDGHVEEEAVQHRRGDVGEGIREEENGQADQDVGEEARESRLSDLDDAVGEIILLEISVPLSPVGFVER